MILDRRVKYEKIRMTGFHLREVKNFLYPVLAMIRRHKRGAAISMKQDVFPYLMELKWKIH